MIGDLTTKVRVVVVSRVNASRRLLLIDARINARTHRERNIVRSENANFPTLSSDPSRARVYDAHNAASVPINVRRAFRILRNTLHYS